MRPVEEIGDKHGVSFGCDALAEIANHRTQARRIVPQQHSRMGAFRGVNKDRIADAIGRFDFTVSVDDGQRSARGCAARSSKSGGQRACNEITPGEAG